MVSIEEVFRAVRMFKSKKAPGQDGGSVECWECHCEIIGRDHKLHV